MDGTLLLNVFMAFSGSAQTKCIYIQYIYIHIKISRNAANVCRLLLLLLVGLKCLSCAEIYVNHARNWFLE